MKLSEKGILLIGALVIVVTGVVLNNYLNSNNYKVYVSGNSNYYNGILLNTKTGDAWRLTSPSKGHPEKEEYTKPPYKIDFSSLAKDKKDSDKSKWTTLLINLGINDSHHIQNKLKGVTKMKKIDIKSFLIGVLITTNLFLIMGFKSNTNSVQNDDRKINNIEDIVKNIEDILEFETDLTNVDSDMRPSIKNYMYIISGGVYENRKILDQLKNK